MGKKSTEMRIGILTAGGDCPGINAAIRGVGKTAIVKYGMKLIGISAGFTGMINKDYLELTEQDLSTSYNGWNNTWNIVRNPKNSKEKK